MANIFNSDNLSKIISEELKLYSQEVVEDLKKINDECTAEFVENTRKDAPKGKRKKFYKNISSTTVVNTPNRKVNLWYVKSPEYRLTHLIKNGHMTRKGRRTRGNDFIDKNYAKLEERYIRETKEVIERGH